MKRLFLILAMLPLLGMGSGQSVITGHHRQVKAPSSINYGVTTVGGSSVTVPNTEITCGSIITGSHASGYSMSSISVYGEGITSGNIQVGVYSPGTGGSSTLVAHSSASSYTSTGTQWWTTSITGTLAASSSYNICYATSTSFMQLIYLTGSTMYINATETYGTWPNSTTLTLDATYSPSIYVTVTPI
jgi:hypothetical protein